MNESTRNIDNNNKSIYKSLIGDDNYNGCSKWVIRNSNNKIDILSYELNFTNGTSIGTATIPNNESFPMPKRIYVTTPVDVTSDGLQKVELFDEDDYKNAFIEPIPYSYQTMDYFNQSGISNLSSEVVLINDYSHASKNETTDKIHLLEFDTNECEDVFYEKIQDVLNSSGAGFIIITTNPSYLKNLSSSVFGVAVPPYEGAKIKSYLQNNQTVIASFNNNPEGEQGNTFEIYTSTGCPGEKKIGLIEESGSQDLWGKYDLPTVMIELCKKPCKYFDYKGFLLFNKTLNKAHYMYSPMGISLYENPNKPLTPWSFSDYSLRPFMFMNGSIHLDSGGSVNIWDWAKNDTNLEASFTIEEKKNDSAESYNVICEIKGKNPNKSILISGGHHDFLWGAGASDDTAGVAIMLGILRWLNESRITPEYNLTFVSFSGEEHSMRGSGFYIFNESFASKNKNMTYMINLDWLAHNTTNSTLRIPVTDYTLTTAIDQTTSRTHYLEKFENITNKKYKIRVRQDAVGNDARPFYDLYVKGMKFYEDKKTDLKILEIGKEKKTNGHLDLMYARHQSGANHTLGDTLDIIDRDDLNITADIALNITKYLILEPPENEFVNCRFMPYDRCGDSWNDSVNIVCNVTTDRTSWVTVEACIHNISTGANVSFTNSTWFTIYEGENASGQINVTLWPIMNNGTYNVSIRLLDEKGNVDDECHQLVNLSPYSKPIANFDYEYGDWIKKLVYFNDTSMASPGEEIDAWNWSFGGEGYSEQQNPAHYFTGEGNFTVSLTITDTSNLSNTVTKNISISNAAASTSFTVNAHAVCVGTQLSFTSTSSDEDGTIENFTWDFGDESYAYTENPVHSYSQSGVYTVSLMTTDNEGATNTSTQIDCLVIADALVDDDFSDNPSAHKWNTIIEGLSDVENGDVIYVFNGSYDPIEVNISVALYGESSKRVLISGGDPNVKILCYNVTLKGFNLNEGACGVDITGCDQGNVRIEDCNLTDNDDIGILLDSSYNCSVVNCTISGSDIGVKIINNSGYNLIQQCNLSNGYYGVYVSGSSHNWIGSPSISDPYPTDCLFTFYQYAIYLDEAESNFILGCDIDGTPYREENPPLETIGIYLDDSADNTISTCKIYDMTKQGIYLIGSAGNKIEHCKIMENDYYGIDLSGEHSSENLIVQNSITDNSNYGIHISLLPTNNHIYYNDFIRNGDSSNNQSYDAKGKGGDENLWSKEGDYTLTKQGPGEGNYWDDYTGEDNNVDGIGDTPYMLDGADQEDSYPVMESYNWCNDWE
jgi:parallel beta-helix repeat protein